MKQSSFAVYDCLYLTGGLTGGGSSTTSIVELQALSYLACLLSVYRGEAASEWGYEFIVADAAAPFSLSLLSASERMSELEFLRTSGTTDGRLGMTERGSRSLESLRRMTRYVPRSPYLDASLAAADALPVPAVQAAISNDPQIAMASLSGSPRPLLDAIGISALHDDFEILGRQFGPEIDVMVPGVVWLSFLLENQLTASNVGPNSDGDS